MRRGGRRRGGEELDEGGRGGGVEVKRRVCRGGRFVLWVRRDERVIGRVGARGLVVRLPVVLGL